MARTRIPSMILRETCMALAVLAMWMLSLLAPLHQTSSLLREMAKAGHDISDAWSICVTLAQDEAGTDHAIPACPAQGIGKTDLALLPPPVLLAEHVAVERDVDFLTEAGLSHWRQNFTPGQPRAPPAQA